MFYDAGTRYLGKYIGRLAYMQPQIGSVQSAPSVRTPGLLTRFFLLSSYSGRSQGRPFFLLYFYASDLRARAIAASTCGGAVPPVWLRAASEPSSVSTP